MKKYLLSMIFMILLTSSSLCYSQGIGNAYNFISPVSYIKSNNNLFFTQQTIEATIKIDTALKGNATLFMDGNDDNNPYIDNRYSLKLIKSGDSTFQLRYQIKIDTGWLVQTSKTFLKYNKWYSITAQFDGNSVSIYVNGLNVDSKVVSNSTKQSLFNLVVQYIGYNPITKGEYFKGLMDEVRYWNIAVPMNTIRLWMHLPLNMDHPNWVGGLSCYYAMEGTVSIASNGHINCMDWKNQRNAYTWGIESYICPKYPTYKKSSFTTSDYYQSYMTPKTLGVFYNNKIFQFSSHGGSPFARSYRGTLDTGNNVVMDNSSIRPIGGQYEVPFACCVYKDKLVYISMVNIDETTQSTAGTMYYHVGTLSNDGDITSNVVSEPIYNCVPGALAVLKDTLYSFYITKNSNGVFLNAYWSLDGLNWTFSRTLQSPSSKLDYHFGNVAACTAIDSTGKEVIYVGYIDSTNKSTKINILSFYHDTQGRNFSIPISKVRNFSMVNGTVEGGSSDGYALQIFYSADTADTYGHSKTIGRFQYSTENNLVYFPEILDITGADYTNESLEHRRFWPYAFTNYQTDGSNNSMRKKIILAVGNVTSSRNQKTDYLVWNSDKMTYIPEADTTDTNPDIRISQLLGVIEGPPPYVLNGENLGDLIKYKIYPSSLEFGSSTNQSQDSSVSINNSWSVSFRYDGLGGDFEHNAAKQNTTEYTKRDFENRIIFPTVGRPNGYQVFIRPIITRKKFSLTDGNDNFLDNIYTLEISDRFIDYIPYYLDTVYHAPNPGDFKSYINRSVNPGEYTKIYSANYSWAAGASSSIGFETDSTVTVSTSEDMYKGVGISINIDMNVGLGIELSTNVFSFESRIGTTTKHEGSISLGNSRNISVDTDCPFNGELGDTSHFSATVYWIKPTAGKNNWWIPKGYEAHNPWCITYKINALSIHPNSVEDGNIGLNKFLTNVYPNPASENITISFYNQDLKITGISISNSLGIEIKRFNEQELTGKKSVSFSSEDLPAGVYYCTMNAGKERNTKSFVVVR